MRALFFGDSPHRVGGAQKSLLAALRQVHRFGVEPIVVFPAGGDAADLYREAGLDVRVLPSPPAVMTFGKALLKLGASGLARVMARELLPYSLELARLAKSERCEVLHFNSPRGLCVAGWAASISRLPAVLHLRGHGDLGRAVWLACQLLADEIIVVAPPALEYVSRARSGHAHLVYNGVDLPASVDRAGARAALVEWLASRGHAVDPSRPLFSSVSALVPFKGIHHLLDAASRAEGAAADAHYVLAGTGLDDGYEDWLSARARELGLAARVHFIGYCDRVSQLLAASDAMLLTSVVRETFALGARVYELDGQEGLPRSILESLAQGTPVITTSGGGVREQVEEGRSGLIIPPSDPDALARALERVAGDSAFRENAFDVARTRIREKFSVESAARGLARVLEQARRAPRRAPAKVKETVGVFTEALS